MKLKTHNTEYIMCKYTGLAIHKKIYFGLASNLQLNFMVQVKYQPLKEPKSFDTFNEQFINAFCSFVTIKKQNAHSRFPSPKLAIVAMF